MNGPLLSVGQLTSDNADMLSKKWADWNLTAAGDAFETHTSWLQPVQWRGRPAMLKVLKPSSDEHQGLPLLQWWNGDGAVRVFARSDNAVLMERGERGGELADRTYFSDRASTDIMLNVLDRLHADRPFNTAVHADADEHPGASFGVLSLPSLRRRFRSLLRCTAEDEALQRCRQFAKTFEFGGPDVRPLHGDIHHENFVAVDRAAGWAVIDPKGLMGDPHYEFANLFGNPAEDPRSVHDPSKMAWLVRTMASHRPGRLCVQRLLDFAYLHAGLSMAWSLEDDDHEGYRHRRIGLLVLEKLREPFDFRVSLYRSDM